jgi:hypothetical protein
VKALVPCTLVKKGGDKLLRIYDALPLHNRDCIRWELQLRNNKASVACDLVSRSASPYEYMASFITGSVDFGLVGGSNLSRDWVRFEWWQSLINDCNCEPHKIPLNNSDTNLDKMITWVKSQCSPSLGVLLRGLGVEEFSQFILNVSTPKMKQNHYLMVNQLVKLKEDGLIL